MSIQNIHIAIVEDDNEIRQTLNLILDGSPGFSCKYAFPDGESALASVGNLPLDIVLMDIDLPKKSGIEVTRQLKMENPKLDIIMLTVQSDDDSIFESLCAGASGYLLKRTSPSQILEAIRDLYEGGSPMSSEIARRVVRSMQSKGKTAETEELLTNRESEILDYLAKGFLYKEIASELFISKETVKKHIHNIYEKLHVQNRTEAINKAFNR